MVLRPIAGLLAVALVCSLAVSAACGAGPAKPPAAAGEAHASPAAQGEGGHAAANPLDFKADLALWSAVVFVLLLLILWRFAWGPIAEGLDKREKLIAGQISEAEQRNREAQALLDQYQQKLAHSQDEVRALIEQARRDAETMGRGLIDKARAEAKREQEQALHQIEMATDGALKELAERSADLAVELAGKIVQARLSSADHRELIQQAVARFGDAKPGRN